MTTGRERRKTSRTENIAIIDRALTRRKDGATRLVKKYKGLIMSNIMRIIPDMTTAQDLLQETFLTAFKNLDQLRSAENLKAWLVQIGKRTALTYRRNKSKQLMDNALSLDDPGGDSGGGPPEVASEEDTIEQRLLEADFERALAKIPENYREALELRFRKKLQFHEIATELKIGVPLAKFRVRYGLQKLREALEPEGPEPDSK